MIDRALYLPESWTEGRERCRRAGIPDSVPFATKPELALTMLQQAVARDMPFGWVTADSIYGDYRRIRLWLETLPKPYVLAVSAKEYVFLGWQQVRVGDLLPQLSAHPGDSRGVRLSAGDGAKGPRLYDWQLVALNPPLVVGWRRWLLVRRSLEDPRPEAGALGARLAAFACCAPAATPLAKLVQVAGSRWHIESAFEEAKGEVGLDQYEVRSWDGWHRHITLACLAHALLAVVRAKTREPLPALDKEGAKKGGLAPDSLAAFKARRGLLSV